MRPSERPLEKRNEQRHVRTDSFLATSWCFHLLPVRTILGLAELVVYKHGVGMEELFGGH